MHITLSKMDSPRSISHPTCSPHNGTGLPRTAKCVGVCVPCFWIWVGVCACSHPGRRQKGCRSLLSEARSPEDDKASAWCSLSWDTRLGSPELTCYWSGYPAAAACGHHVEKSQSCRGDAQGAHLRITPAPAFGPCSVNE